MKTTVIDIGGTEIKYGLVDETDSIIKKNTRQTSLLCLNDLISDITNIMNETGGSNGLAISMPGVIDSRRGIAKTGGALKYINNTPLVKILESSLGIPVTIENDGNCAALAEARKGSLKNASSGIVYLLGTGVAGGLILNKELIRGHNFSAAEFSCVCTDVEQWENREVLAGFTGSSVEMIQKIKKYKGIQDKFNGKEAFKLIKERDASAFQIFTKYLESIAIQLYNLQAILDIELIAIGGGISKQPILFEELKEVIDKLYMRSPLVRTGSHIIKPKITKCLFHNDSNLYGAYENFIELKG